MFRQERYERNDLREALRGVLPPPHAPSLKNPSRDAFSVDCTAFQYGNVPHRKILRSDDEAVRVWIQGEGACNCGSNFSAPLLGRFFGYFLIGIRKYRPRQGAEVTSTKREGQDPPLLFCCQSFKICSAVMWAICSFWLSLSFSRWNRSISTTGFHMGKSLP